jgi:RepB DNA-primase from phage plasmid
VTNPAAQPLDTPIDRDQIRHFLRTLDPGAKWFTVQTFTDREHKPNPDPFAKVFNVSRLTRPVLDLYAQGAATWVAVNDTGGNGRKASAITRVRDVWQEDDDGYEGGFPLEPSLVIETSPGHYHRHWFVDGDWPADPQGRADFAGVMRRMIADYGSDPGAKDISRVLRVPGLLHRKNPAEPHMVRIVGGNGQRYTREHILAAFPPLEKTSARGNGRGHADNGYSEAYAELVRQVLTGENYHAALTSLAWRQVVAGMPGGQAVEHLRGVMLSTPESARDDRWHARFAEIPRLVSSAEEKQADVSGELRPPAFSDDALADAFAEQHADRLRYVARSNVWYRYDDTRWVEEERPGIFEAARSICREAAKRCKNVKEKKKHRKRQNGGRH